MKLKRNKKGFTIVELVIVIAVIAILAAVLIPTFANVSEKAQQSAAMQAARNEYEVYLAEYAQDLDGEQDLVIVKGDYAFKVTDGQFNPEAEEAANSYAGADLSKVYKKVDSPVAGNISTYYEKTANAEYTKTTDGEIKAAKTYYTQTEEDLGSKDVAIYAAAQA